MTQAAERVLIAGGGFVGRALAEALRRDPRQPEVVVVARRTAPGVVAADLGTPAGRATALAHGPFSALVWLIHSLDAPDVMAHDPALAAAMARDAHAHGIPRAIYLGALGDGSLHTQSRHATGKALADVLPTTELRASVVIGPGSAVIEMVRALSRLLPILPIPAGADVPTQPIALSDAVAGLVEATLGPARPGIFDLAGDDIVPWSHFMTRGAALLGHRRPSFRMPFATPRLSALTLAALTPLSRTMAEQLVRGLGTPSIARPERRWPLASPTTFEAAMALALQGSR